MTSSPLTPLTDRPLDHLVAEFLAAELAAEPVSATALGVDGFDDRLPDRSAAAYAERDRREDGWLGRFTALSEDSLTRDERIDRDLVVGSLRGRIAVRDWADWRRNPDAYSGAGLMGVFTLFTRRPLPEPELAAAAAARLRQVPDVLAAGRANLDPDLASPVLVERALGQARAGIAYARDVVPGEVEDGPGRRAVHAAAEVAAAAYEDFAAFLTDFVGRARGDFAIGEERYSALLRQQEGLTYGARELRERGRAAYDELAADLRDRAAQLGADDWRALVADLDADHPASPADMREAYAEWTDRARAFALERGVVSEPEGERCLVVPAPPFQRSMIAVAAYLPPASFGADRIGRFLVPYPPDDASDEQVRQRLATNSSTLIPSVAVHETWPGHHWQLSWMNAGGRPVRRVLTSAFFVEGWALYAEQILADRGFFTDPRQRLRQVDMRLFRAARIIVDTSLHLGEMTVPEAEEFMTTRSSLSPETAAAEVARYCAWPTQAASYLTGALEIGRLRDDWLAAGRGTEREFHDRLGATGCLPLGLAEHALHGQER